jgi:outer membrane murein-binding lipoprotein Lpp
VLLLACTFVLGAAACSSDSSGDNGAVTQVDKLGPDVAKLRLEVQQLRQEVQSLRDEVAALQPASSDTTTTTTPAG